MKKQKQQPQPEEPVENSENLENSDQSPAENPVEEKQRVEQGASEINDDDSEIPEEVQQKSKRELLAYWSESQQEIAGLKDGYIRAKAEVENIQRRSQNEIIAARKYAIEGFAQELLSVADSLDQASKVEMEESNSEAVKKMHEGLQLTLKQFEKVMEKFGVKSVEAETGVKFNPDLHQAISMVPSDEVEPDHILTVMQKGYALKDRLLRPAMVVIAQNTSE